ncbi:hypothetical protein AKO1_007075 [Acrasis kona]|uniref:RRM domain-containing protein n=1 Tax=Acrasis kona TaxID=1008807 RepID=A0AAW2YT65_9EUKA
MQKEHIPEEIPNDATSNHNSDVTNDLEEDDALENERKRKWREEMDLATLMASQENSKPAKKPKRKNEKPKQEQQPFNSSIFVSGLPKDITVPDILEYFEKKCGQVKLDSVTAIPKIKFYKGEDGENTGDALITFFKEPSVALAIALLDETEIKPGHMIKIQVAQFKEKEKQPQQALSTSITGTMRKKTKPVVDQNRKLQWGFGGDTRFEGRARSVILKHMFTPDEFAQEPLLREELKQDIKGECEKLGPVEKIRIFQDNPDGVVEVKFKLPTSAEECVTMMQGRHFGGRVITAELWDQKTNYFVKESKEEQEQRHEKFGNLVE